MAPRWFGGSTLVQRDNGELIWSIDTRRGKGEDRINKLLAPQRTRTKKKKGSREKKNRGTARKDKGGELCKGPEGGRGDCVDKLERLVKDRKCRVLHRWRGGGGKEKQVRRTKKE